jgi:heptosyltransferase III
MDRTGDGLTMLRRNVLIFHSGGLGDFVLTWPLAAALGRLHPQSRIIYVTDASKGDLVAKVLRLDWMDAETAWPALYSDATKLPEKFAKVLVHCHSIYTFIASEGDAWHKNVAALAPEAAIYCARVKPPAEYSRHASEFLLEQLAGFAAVRGAVEQILASIQSKGIGTLRAAETHQGPIILHPGSGAREKCWPVKGFVELARSLVDLGVSVKIVLGEVELERFSQDEIKELESASPKVLVVRPSRYADLLTELAVARALVGNDSGPAHLAAVIGVPTVCVFGPTDPHVWRPMGPVVRVIRRANLSELTADQVVQSLDGIG